MLEELKLLLGISDASLDDKLNLIIRLTTSRLKVLLGGAKEIPESLQYIITEVAVIRFNRIGSEGISSHGVEGESLSFTDDDFSGYRAEIQAYLDKVDCTAQKGDFLFL
ncbi:MAG: phage head-tail connector protein [Lachnospiraceae bacterium]|uniref:phage head-tail connector protein n=1 Tax=Zhenpiania hominis TaxID=2763644 RepID=UPI002F993533